MDTPPCSTCSLPSPSPLHTLLCAALSSPPPKPSGSHILALLFPSSPSTTPTPVWIPLTTSTDDETSITFQSVETSAIFPLSAYPSGPEVLYTERNTVRGRDTESMLEIWTAPPSRSGEKETAEGTTTVNETVAALAEGRDGPFHEWKGPVLALAMTRATGFMVDPGAYKDVSVGDAGDVVDFLLDFGNPEHGRRVREALDTLGSERPGEEPKADTDGIARMGEENGEQASGEEEDHNVVFEAM